MLCEIHHALVLAKPSELSNISLLVQVLAVVQQAVQAAVSDLSDDVQAANVGSVVEGCVCAHFRCALLLAFCLPPSHITLFDVSGLSWVPQSILHTPHCIPPALLIFHG